jgi:1,5-anhydro-D-fructose reductase (1,5-anhydro-D-mannitol-forming)
MEDAVMGVMYFRYGVLAQFHDALTIAHAGTELHGTEGPSLGIDHDPDQSAVSHFAGLSEEVKLEAAEDLYIRSVHNFNEAVKGNGQPSATGEDGLKSLAVGLAVLESAKTGRQVKVRHQ